ncbi:MAG: hypothetical protein AAGF71_12315 [Pseudomonadota bacterium]
MTLWRIMSVALLALLLGCTSELEPEVAQSSLEDFSLGRLIVVVDAPGKGALSRTASDDVINASVTNALNAQFGRFDGRGQYILGVKVVGYVLAQPGIPVILAPRSILLMNVLVFDPAGRKLHDDPKRLTVFEDAGGDTVVGSGYTQSAQEQLDELSSNAAIEIEKWMRENADWFVLPPELSELANDTVSTPET